MNAKSRPLTYISMHKLLLSDVLWVDVTEEIALVRAWLRDRRGPGLRLNAYGQAYDRSLHFVVVHAERIFIPKGHWTRVCSLMCDHYGGPDGLRAAYPALADAVARTERGTLSGACVREIREAVFTAMSSDVA